MIVRYAIVSNREDSYILAARRGQSCPEAEIGVTVGVRTTSRRRSPSVLSTVENGGTGTSAEHLHRLVMLTQSSLDLLDHSGRAYGL